jgi:hypothetical protein
MSEDKNATPSFWCNDSIEGQSDSTPVIVQYKSNRTIRKGGFLAKLVIKSLPSSPQSLAKVHADPRRDHPKTTVRAVFIYSGTEIIVAGD